MKKSFKVALVVLLLLGVGAYTAFYIATHDIIVLNSKGMIGIKERDLILTASELMLIVVVPVMILTWFFAWKYRANKHRGRHEPDWEHNYIAEYCWWGVPVLIVAILSVITWRSTHQLNPFKPLESEKKPMVIQAIALEWKWLFIYPEQGIATVNFIQFPEKIPLNFEITSDAPMNSFWIPQLGGQIYAMPAMRSKLHLMANETGTFEGRSASYSGKGFAGMRFKAKASTEQEFNQWVAQVKRSPKRLGLAEYDQLLKPSEYAPATFYVLTDPKLFDAVIAKYTTPQEKRH